MVRERDVEFLWAFACACENRAEACRRNAPQNCLCLSKPSSLKVLELVSMNMFYAKQLWGTCDFGQTIPVFVSLRRTWSPAISLTAVRKRCMDSRGGFSVCVCVCVCKTAKPQYRKRHRLKIAQLCKTRNHLRRAREADVISHKTEGRLPML